MAQVNLVEYQASWPAQFQAAGRQIEAAIENDAAQIEHIGSTAVPGMCAKPVLDILMGLDSISNVTALIHRLREIGYVYRPEYEKELPDRRYFVRSEGSSPRIHLHVVEHERPLWTRHLAFRDALSTNTLLALEYATLKRELATRHAHNKAAYTEAKGPFIVQTLATIAASETPSAV